MNTSRFFLLLTMVTISVTLSAQNEQEPDTLVKEPAVVPFIRLGFDVSSVARAFTEPEVRQFEISADSELLRNWFFNLEGGILMVNSEQESFTYNASGFFFRTGVDFNLLGRPHAEQNDLVLIGFRYAYSSLWHEAPFYLLDNPYWGSHTGSIDRSSYYAHWVEFAGGVKTEVFKNFFLGWTLRTRIPLVKTKDPEIQPYYIGGFGQGKRRAPVMVHFSAFYKLGL